MENVSSVPNKRSLLLTGVGLRTPHYQTFLRDRPPLAWVEVHSENYFADGGKPLYVLEKIRHDYPISLHGVSLSLGSSDELNWQHLRKLRELISRVNPCLVSEHLSWSSINGHYLHDLLPLPFTEETLEHIVRRIQQTQEYLSRQILVENVSTYCSFDTSTLFEADFLKEVATSSGCGILLDINNIYVNSVNLNFDPFTYISKIPPPLVQEIHLGGFTQTKVNDQDILIDTHSRRVDTKVWQLYKFAIQTLGCKPTIIEWDADIPDFEILYAEAEQAETIMRENYVATKLTSRAS